MTIAVIIKGIGWGLGLGHELRLRLRLRLILGLGLWLEVGLRLEFSKHNICDNQRVWVRVMLELNIFET